MRIFLVPTSPAGQPSFASAVDRLCGLRQEGRPLERYVDEFFRAFLLVETINLVLSLNGSDFEIEEVQKESCFPRPVPSEIQAARLVPQPPVSSECPSSGYSPGVQPIPMTRPPKKRAIVKPTRPKKMAADHSDLRYVPGLIRERRGLFSSVEDPHLTSVRAASIPKPPPVATLSSIRA
ncbi:hypothetical protein DPX16_1514 [Anabarilius grahami]|uniref:Uncharacterized protein n=1 Tax=Anabarilius grahami TaxID=495550 RepID=A0A3N0YZ35_ANAGA|nr:hypothetical protein DPX16_1514 [Anabarilius grahami]